MFKMSVSLYSFVTSFPSSYTVSLDTSKSSFQTTPPQPNNKRPFKNSFLSFNSFNCGNLSNNDKISYLFTVPS